MLSLSALEWVMVDMNRDWEETLANHDREVWDFVSKTLPQGDTMSKHTMVPFGDPSCNCTDCRLHRCEAINADMLEVTKGVRESLASTPGWRHSNVRILVDRLDAAIAKAESA